MACRPKTKMSSAERARQFAPFAALGGLEAALAKKEAELLYEEKKTLADEAVASINRVLRRVEDGMTVRVEYYDVTSRRYLSLEGEVLVHDKLYGTVRIADKVIMYDEISGIEILRK